MAFVYCLVLCSGLCVCMCVYVCARVCVCVRVRACACAYACVRASETSSHFRCLDCAREPVEALVQPFAVLRAGGLHVPAQCVLCRACRG